MILDDFKLNGKVALVTGAGQGLGLGMSLALAEAGADVAGLDRSASTDTSKAVQVLGRRYLEIVCDLRDTSAEGLNKIAADIVSNLGHLDILVNNAGITKAGPLMDFSVEDLRAQFEVNLFGVHMLSEMNVKDFFNEIDKIANKKSEWYTNWKLKELREYNINKIINNE